MISFIWPIICYLFSSIPQSYLLVKKIKGIDIRKVGKEKLSGSNVMKEAGFALGFLIGLLDLFKGYFSVFFALKLGLSEEFVALSGISALAGQMWPIFLKFWGGRGGSICAGVILALSPKILLYIAWVWIILKILSKDYGGPLGMSLFIFLAGLLGYLKEEKALFLFFAPAFFLVHLQRILGKPGSLFKIKDKKILLYRFFLDRDTKERY